MSVLTDDSRQAITVSGEYTETDRTRSVEEGCETLPPEVRASDRRSGAVVSGMIRGPLGDIYSQVHKVTDCPESDWFFWTGWKLGKGKRLA